MVRFAKSSAAMWLVALSLVWGGAVHGQTQAQPSKPGTTKEGKESGELRNAASMTSPLGAYFKVPPKLVQEQSRLVFYRTEAEPTQKGHAGAVSIFIDGVYQASVQQGAFTQLCLPPGKIEVQARYVDNELEVSEPYDVVNTLTLKPGEDSFVKVFESPRGRAVMMTPSVERALNDLVKTREQRHTISRVFKAQVCRDMPKPDEPAKPAKPLRTITLGADALFAFGKSDIDSIPAKGRKILDSLAQRIRSEFGDGSSVQIHITGHADKFGTEATNLRLSKERAETVKAYLVKGGLKAQNITTEGRGDKEPVVTTCDKAYNAKSVACNKPNRRVVLEVRGNQPVEASN